MEVGEREIKVINTYRSTVTTRMTPALRWAVMRAILMFYCEGQNLLLVSVCRLRERGRRSKSKSVCMCVCFMA